MRNQLVFMFVILCWAAQINAQGCCDMDTEMVICYTSKDDFCTPTGDCRYTFDGTFMQGLRNKISNPDNYSLNGIVDCELRTVPLVDISSVQDIEDVQCDLIFIGNFAQSSSGGLGTTIDDSFFDIVIEWSKKCSQNIVIAFQGEAEKWGYQIEGGNINPNTKGGNAGPNIFDGPFGSITNFNQGGSFQATFISLNPNGTTILAEDASGRPTIVLDRTTNDILMADVGIVCNTAGSVTTSPNIIVGNDVLACNIMALGCTIASADIESIEDIFICQNESFTLADGQVVDQEGVYSTTVLSVDQCDSTITTNLMFSIPPDGESIHDGCDGDGYSVVVGNATYDQNNPFGSEILQNQYGCDSLVVIELEYKPHTYGFFDTIICPEDTFTFHGLWVNEELDEQVVIPNSEGCDSIIDVVVQHHDVIPYSIDRNVIIENDRLYLFENDIDPSYQVQWQPDSGLSCTSCPNPSLKNKEHIDQYILTITTDASCVIREEIDVRYSCLPYVPNMFNINSVVGNEKFGPQAPCRIIDFSMNIYDRWGSRIFHSTDQDDHWNGRFKGQDVISGVYFYKMEFIDLEEPVEIIGSITVIQ